MSEKRPVLSLWFSREEWLLAFFFQWVAKKTGAYGVAEMNDEERGVVFDSYGSGLLWATRKLDEICSFPWRGLEVNRRTGVVTLKGQEPVEPRNELFLVKLRAGRMPSPLIGLPIAMSLLRERGVNIDPMMEVYNTVKQDVSEVQAEFDEDPELGLAVERSLDELMKHAGLVRLKEVH